MKKTNHWKSVIIFASWVLVGLSALLVTNAYQIQTNINNAVQYIMRTVVTTDGSSTAANTLFDVNYNASWNVYIKNNLGIWTTGPVEKLDVTWTGKFSWWILSSWAIFANWYEAISSSNIILRAMTGVYDIWDIVFLTNSWTQGARIRTTPAYDTWKSLYLSTNDTNPDITVNLSGNVGIGTNSPTAKLDVLQSSNINPAGLFINWWWDWIWVIIRAWAGWSWYAILETSKYDQTPGLYINWDANVGIGITGSNIKSKLQVVWLQEYADNAVALAAWLTVWAFYRTADVLKVVH